LNIFISYSSKNRSQIEVLAEDLSGLGHDVWYDVELTGGMAWWDQILHNIRQCDLFIFALAPESLDSYPCQLEFGYAHSLQKRILPVLLSTVNTNLLPTALSHIQFVDYKLQDKKATIALGRALTSLPNAQPLPDPLPPAPLAPISPLGKVRDQLNQPTLSFEQQAALIFELKQMLNEEGTEDDARQLLVRLRERNDLYANIDREIEGLVAGKSVVSSPVSTPAPAPIMPPPAAPLVQKTVVVTEKAPPAQPSDTAVHEVKRIPQAETTHTPTQTASIVLRALTLAWEYAACVMAAWILLQIDVSIYYKASPPYKLMSYSEVNGVIYVAVFGFSLLAAIKVAKRLTGLNPLVRVAAATIVGTIIMLLPMIGIIQTVLTAHNLADSIVEFTIHKSVDLVVVLLGFSIGMALFKNVVWRILLATSGVLLTMLLTLTIPQNRLPTIIISEALPFTGYALLIAVLVYLPAIIKAVRKNLLPAIAIGT
jgi:hypothetical protein